MKCQPIAAAFLIASCLCVQARERSRGHELECRVPQTFLEFEGTEVRNLQDEALGKVYDITINLKVI